MASKAHVIDVSTRGGTQLHVFYDAKRWTKEGEGGGNDDDNDRRTKR